MRRNCNSDEQQEVLEAIARTMVQARAIQHLCWNMQHDLKHIGERGLEIQDSIFHSARAILDELGIVYSELPDAIKSKRRLSFCSSDEYIHHIYDTMNDFDELESYSENESKIILSKIKFEESNLEDHKNQI